MQNHRNRSRIMKYGLKNLPTLRQMFIKTCRELGGTELLPLPAFRPGRSPDPEQRALWFEHHLYYALRTLEEYVWLYTEDANWWTGESLPEGFPEALQRAREKVNNLEPLVFTVEEMLEEAKDRAEEKYRNK